MYLVPVITGTLECKDNGSGLLFSKMLLKYNAMPALGRISKLALGKQVAYNTPRKLDQKIVVNKTE